MGFHSKIRKSWWLSVCKEDEGGGGGEERGERGEGKLDKYLD